MSVMILFSLLISSIMMVPLMTQPLSLGLMIIILTFFMSLVGGFSVSSWYGYLLFLIYVGGLLVMFVYVSSLSPNILFDDVPMKSFFLFLVLSFSILGFNCFLDSKSFFDMNSSISFSYSKMMSCELSSFLSISILVSLGLILFVNMVAVVKICSGPFSFFRPFLGK